MKFPPDILDEIRARLPVSAVVGKKVKLKKHGREWRGLSPFNKEKTPSFYVNDAKGFYHCFSSGKHGDQFSFIMETEGLSFPESVEKLAEEVGVKLPEKRPEDTQLASEKERLYDVLAKAERFFIKTRLSQKGRKAQEYLAKRGTLKDVMETFGLGYAPPEKHTLREELAAEGILLEDMLKAGLLTQPEEQNIAIDRFRDRLIFPIHDAKGRTIGFGGRALNADAAAKYLNSPETPLFHKGNQLYNLHRARIASHKSGQLYVVEGYFDVLALHSAGFPETVAPMGTALTEEQLMLLWRMCETPTLCFDGDKAGLRAAYRALDVALPHLSTERSLKIVLLPQGQDPDDLFTKGGATAVSLVLQTTLPIVDLIWQRETQDKHFQTPEDYAKLSKKLKSLTLSIKDEDLREHYTFAFKERQKQLKTPIYQGKVAYSPSNQTRNRDQRKNLSPRILTPALSNQAKQSLTRTWKQEELNLVLIPIHHPSLAIQEAETLGNLHFSNPELQKLCSEWLTIISQNTPDGREKTEQVLAQSGLKSLYEKAREKLHPAEWRSQPDASFQDAYLAWTAALDLHHRAETLNKDLKQAERELSETYTEASFARLTEIQDRKSELEHATALSKQSQPSVSIRGILEPPKGSSTS